VKLRDTARVSALKLCVVIAVAVLPVFACREAETAETWAKKVCSVVQALPEASASSLPAGTKVTITAASGSASAVVESPSASARMYGVKI
jgi:hypothetical protein